MILAIRWTIRAKSDYARILEYLQTNWTTKELQKFTAKTNKVLSQIAKNPEIFPASKKINARKCVLIEQVSIYYQIKKGEVLLVSFWDNRQNPKKKKF